MSAIINAGENLILERQASISQTKTQGGRRVAQKRGPLLYNLEVQVPFQRLNDSNYFKIEKEVISLAYGQYTFQEAGVSGLIGGNMTSQRGQWSGTPLIDGSSQTGTTINISTGENSVTNYAREFDYVQFGGSTKAYQLMSNVDTDSSGKAVLSINSPIITSPVNASAVVFGLNVNFNFALVERPDTGYQPGKIVQYGTFRFEEVIENETRTAGSAGTNRPLGGISSTTLFGSLSAADLAGVAGALTYSISTDTNAGLVRVRLDGNDSSLSTVGITGSGSITISETGDIITINGTDETGIDEAIALSIALG